MIADRLLFGGDYNPEQWMDEPGILDKDLELMKKAGVNVVSLGIFSWAEEEPEEGRYEFDWLADIIHRLYENGISTILATPSGARPRWLAKKYPEVLRVDAERRRQLFGGRENHCMTSPIYREKVHDIDLQLAKRFGKDPAVILWHISNEFCGDCHCALCQDAFRGWVRRKYKTVDALNHAYWARFWSHTYTSFDEVESPSPIGEGSIQALKLDWRKYSSDQTIDFMKAEIAALREGGAAQPVTTNMMYNFDGVNYGKMAKFVDVICWDSYPEWYDSSIYRAMERHSMNHDFMRCLKDQSFLLMESCPSGTNWQEYSKLKAPGLLTNEGLNAVAHGSDSIQYFQIRQGRGSFEKFHGALIDHSGRDDTRVFQEAARIGKALQSDALKAVLGARTVSKAALIMDLENRWALDGSAGPRNAGHGYLQLIEDFYHALRRCGVNVDVIDAQHDLSGYSVVAAPMLYSMSDETAERLRKFAEGGGTLILTFWTGIVDENDLVYIDGAPHGLTEAAGLHFEEIDTLPDGRENSMEPARDGVEEISKEILSDGIDGKRVLECDAAPAADSDTKHCTAAFHADRSYHCGRYCELDRLETAQPLMVYGQDFYAGGGALSANRYGKGQVYYLSTWPQRAFLKRFMRDILAEAGVQSLVESLPKKVAVTEREKDGVLYLFLQNFSDEEKVVSLRQTAERIYSSGAHGQTPDFEKRNVPAGTPVRVEALSTCVLKC